MPEQKLTKQYNTFVKGLVTEANALTFPENASVDEENFVLNRDGSRQRRLGIDYETDYQVLDTSVAVTSAGNLVTSSHAWTSVNGDPLVNFNVIQYGAKLYIYSMDSTSVTENYKDVVDLTTYKHTYSNTVGQAEIQTISTNGVLVCVSKELTLLYIKYDKTLDSFSANTSFIQIRDYTGVDDGLDPTERPTTLTDTHKYNLLNQGWPAETYCGLIDKSGTVIYTPSYADPISFTFDHLGFYPSNSDYIALGRRDTVTAGSDVYSDFYEPQELQKKTPSTSIISKGKYKIQYDYRGTQRGIQTGLAVTQDVIGATPTTVTKYAGRVWYAGVETNQIFPDSSYLIDVNYNGTLFFSQIMTDIDKLSKCYQEADPTDENNNQLVDTDGGFITIPGIKRIVKIIPSNDSLVILAENGVWQLRGDEGGFRPSLYQVNKVSNVGVMGASSIIEFNNSIFYWGESGIYVLQYDPTSFGMKVDSITEQSIKTLYGTITNIAKKYAVGTVDTEANKIYWMYNDDSSYDGLTYRNKYNKELVFDVVLGAFYKNSIAINGIYSTGYINIDKFITTTDAQDIVVGADYVEAGGDQVQVNLFTTAGTTSAVKYVTVIEDTTIKITVSEYKNTDFLDWYIYDSTGTDYTSYLTTGYEILGDVMRKKQAPYLMMHHKRTETGLDVNGDPIGESSCLVQAQWEWTDSAASNRWGTQFQTYRYKKVYTPTALPDTTFDYGFSVITTKNKLRGHGRALSLYISSETEKDLHLYGWGLDYSARGVV